MKPTEFIQPPEYVIPHEYGRQFIGASMVALSEGKILLSHPRGPLPNYFPEEEKQSLPALYHSPDGGITWVKGDSLPFGWNLSGCLANGGFSFLKLLDGRLALAMHQYNYRNRGGDFPVISFSDDGGTSWSDPRQVEGQPGAYYVLNDRLIQLHNGRLVLAASRSTGEGVEGFMDEGLCFFSDDLGESWSQSSELAVLPDSLRGVSEADVIELEDGRLMMLSRSGTGYLMKFISKDQGDTWSEGQPTSLVSPCSSFSLRRMPDYRLIVFYTHAEPLSPGSFWPRTPLACATSTDEGTTWSEPVLIDPEGAEKGDRAILCPTACFTEGGIVLIYTVLLTDQITHRKSLEEKMIGGGKRCILAYP